MPRTGEGYLLAPSVVLFAAILGTRRAYEWALDSLDGRIHWVGGGKSKEGPSGYRPFAAAVAARVPSAHAFGAARHQ